MLTANRGLHKLNDRLREKDIFYSGGLILSIPRFNMEGGGVERLSIKEMRFQLSLRGISTFGMSERIEFEKALQDNPVSSATTAPSPSPAKPSPPPSTSLSMKRPLSTTDSSLVSSSFGTSEKNSKKAKKSKKLVVVEPEPLTCFWAVYEDNDREFLKKRKKKKNKDEFATGWFELDVNDDLPTWFSKQCGHGEDKPENFPSELFSFFSFLTKRNDLSFENNGDRESLLKRKLIVKQLGKEQGPYCSAELGVDSLYSFYRNDEKEVAALISSKAISNVDVQTMLLQRIGINYEVIRLAKKAAEPKKVPTTKRAMKTDKRDDNNDEDEDDEDNDDDEY